MRHLTNMLATVGIASLVASLSGPAFAQEKRPNIVMLMTDDTGWNDFGAYSGGGAASDIRRRTSTNGGGRRGLHELVRAGELHGWPSLLHDRTDSDPLRAVRCRRSR